jgi:hypothetical protein
MSILNRMLVAACVALAVALPARFVAADPVNAKHVAADAKWYLHLDFAAAKQTVLYSTVLDAVRARFPLDDTLAQVKAFLGVDPLADITGVTVYNNSFQKDVAAILIHGQITPGPIQAALAQNPDYREAAYNNHTILSWTDNNDGKHKTGCFYGPGLVVMADREETLRMAVDVLDGAKAGGSALVKAPEAGAFLYGSADLAASEHRNVGQLLSNTEAATVSAGEVDGRLTVTVRLTARNAETAGQIMKMAEGMMAFGQLATGRDYPTAAGLLREVKLKSEGTHVTATFTHDSKTVVETLKKLDAEKKGAAKQKEDGAGERPQGL